MNEYMNQKIVVFHSQVLYSYNSNLLNNFFTMSLPGNANHAVNENELLTSYHSLMLNFNNTFSSIISDYSKVVENLCSILSKIDETLR